MAGDGTGALAMGGVLHIDTLSSPMSGFDLEILAGGLIETPSNVSLKGWMRARLPLWLR